MKKYSLHICLLFSACLLLQCTGIKGPDIFDRLSFSQPEGFTDSLLVGHLEVYENRDTRVGRKIPLFVAVTPALVRDSLMEPIFIIDGGPGVGVSHQSYFYTEEYTEYRRYHDIVFVDVRGTGRSSPLHCIELQTKSSPQEYFDHPYPESDLIACLESLRDSVDLNFYKTRYIVEDLEEVRQWLGYAEINLLAISFGGKVALQYMHRYPSSIASVVLHGPDAPNIDYLSRRGRYTQRSIDLLFRICDNDTSCQTHFPNLEQEFTDLMVRLKNERDTYEIIINDSIHKVEIKWSPVAAKIAGMLYDDYNYVQIPHIIHEAYLKNYEPLLEAMDVTSTETHYFFADGMWLSNICAEDMGPATENYDEKEKETFLGDYTYQTRKQACESWPVEFADPDDYMPVVSDIKTLIFSGNLDPVVPPETGALVARHLTNVEHITIPYMGHMLGALSNLECYDHYVLAFLEGRDDELNADCFKEMKPGPFKVSASGQERL